METEELSQVSKNQNTFTNQLSNQEIRFWRKK
jgi:hypothetical protein